MSLRLGCTVARRLSCWLSVAARRASAKRASRSLSTPATRRGFRPRTLAPQCAEEIVDAITEVRALPERQFVVLLGAKSREPSRCMASGGCRNAHPGARGCSEVDGDDGPDTAEWAAGPPQIPPLCWPPRWRGGHDRRARAWRSDAEGTRAPMRELVTDNPSLTARDGAVHDVQSASVDRRRQPPPTRQLPTPRPAQRPTQKETARRAVAGEGAHVQLGGALDATSTSFDQSRACGSYRRARSAAAA